MTRDRVSRCRRSRLRWPRGSLARRSLASIRGADIAAYRDERHEAGKSPITVNNELILVSHLCNTARREWGMESLVNPVSNVRKPKRPPGRDRRLVGDEEQRLLEQAEYPMRELIVLALETGMRQGELMALTWPEFGSLHPFVPEDQAAGYAELIGDLSEKLCAITGYDAISMMPNSGAQGEYAGLLTIRAYHLARGDAQGHAGGVAARGGGQQFLCGGGGDVEHRR